MLRFRPSTTRDRLRVPIRLLILGATAGLVIAACAGSASRGIVGEDGASAAPAAAPYAAPTAAPTAAVPAADGGGGSTAGGVTGDQTDVAPGGPLIVRTGSLSLEVASIDDAVLQSRARIIGLGGYLSDSERSNSGDSATALITFRIPAAHWDEALDGLRGLATRELGEQTRADDVTGQVLDLGARIDNLQATERALQAIMAQATKVSDILDVQNQLTNVQGQIEELSTQKAHLGDRAALGTLAVTYTLPPAPIAHVSNGFSLSAEFDRAVAQLLQIGQVAAVTAVWLAVVVLPIVLAALLIAGLAVLVSRRLRLVRPAGTPGG